MKTADSRPYPTTVIITVPGRIRKRQKLERVFLVTTKEIIESLEESVQDLRVGLVMAKLIIGSDNFSEGQDVKNECVKHAVEYIQQYASDINDLTPVLCRKINSSNLKY